METKRKNEMLQKREQGWTLDKIGVFFGVSRERVRQIIGSGTKRTTSKNQFRATIAANYLAITSSLDKTNKEFIEIYKKYPNWQGRRHKIDGCSNVAKGYNAEELVSRKLNELGITHKLTNSKPIDIILDNGTNIEVKSREKPTKLNSGSSFYFFALEREVNKNIADYFVLVIPNTFFIIPARAIPNHGGVGFTFPKSGNNQGRFSKWHGFENRWDLLKKDNIDE